MKTRYTKLQSKEEIRKLVEQFITDFGDKKWVESKLEEIGERISHFEDKCKEYNELLKVLLVSKETGVN
jgi:hypothetical protein